MMIAVTLMCGGSLMVALLPTYASVGIAAPALLLIARLLQGLSVGGEYGTSATYVSEVATQRNRGFYASFQSMTLIGGQLLVVLFCFMLLQPLFGAISDRIGRRNSMLCFGVLSMLGAAPILAAPSTVSSPYAAFGLVLLALTIASFYTAISGVVKAELFPMHVRAMGVGLSYAVANAAFGGSAEYVALWFKSAGIEAAFFWYVTALCGVALIAAIVMPDTRRQRLLVEQDLENDMAAPQKTQTGVEDSEHAYPNPSLVSTGRTKDRMPA